MLLYKKLLLMPFGKTLVLYNETVFVALVLQHAMRMGHIVIWFLSVCTVFLHII